MKIRQSNRLEKNRVEREAEEERCEDGEGKRAEMEGIKEQKEKIMLVR